MNLTEKRILMIFKHNAMQAAAALVKSGASDDIMISREGRLALRYLLWSVSRQPNDTTIYAKSQGIKDYIELYGSQEPPVPTLINKQINETLADCKSDSELLGVVANPTVADLPLLIESIRRERRTKKIETQLIESLSRVKDKFDLTVTDNLESWRETVDDISQMLNNYSPAAAPSRYTSISAATDMYLERREQKKHNPLIGFPTFDDMLHKGLFAGSLIIYAGDTGSMKTTLMLSMALSIAEQGRRVLYLPLEWDRDSTTEKLLAMLSGVSVKRLSDPHPLTTAEKQMMTAAKSWITKHGENLSIIDWSQSGLTIDSLRTSLESIEYKPEVVVLDYLTLLGSPSDIRNANAAVWDAHEANAKALRRLGQERGFAVITNCQLTREAIKDMRSKKKDKLAALGTDAIRGGHGIVMAAEAAFAIYNDDVAGQLLIYCLKNRHGPRTFGKYKKPFAALHIKACGRIIDEQSTVDAEQEKMQEEVDV